MGTEVERHETNTKKKKGGAETADLQTEFLFELSAELEKPLEVGPTPHGYRRIAYIKGGSVKGPKLTGEVLPGGGDWPLLRPDGVSELDIRLTCHTEAGQLVYIFGRGIVHMSGEARQRMRRGEAVDPSEYYYRTAAFFETTSEKYGWLNRIVAVGFDSLAPNKITVRVYGIL